MSNRGAYLAGLLFIAFAVPAFAQVAAVIFERETIRIESPAPKKSQPAKSTHPALSFDTEIRPEDALRLEYIHTLNELTDNSGVMIAFAAPSVVSIPQMQVPTAIDVLFVMNNGAISEILPGVVLADLHQDIVSRAPIKAFLFLKAGTVKTLGIQPGDIVYGKKFTPDPPMME